VSRIRSNAVSEVMSVQLSVCVRIAAPSTVISLWERWGICYREFIHLNEKCTNKIRYQDQHRFYTVMCNIVRHSRTFIILTTTTTTTTTTSSSHTLVQTKIKIHKTTKRL
jgi:hypothetical protein